MRTWLEELSGDECGERLAQVSVGRLGVVIDGRPEIFPVNHAYEPESGGVVFPTNPRTKLHGALHWPFVAFEVDGLTDDGSGWSVLIVGTAEEVTVQEEITRAAGRRRAVWAVSDQTHWVRVRPTKVTGRRIVLVER
jgi:nitroimidazol reductase NimA-like FMN-containing flavoprotein (pyridoxamine 5'-phosphate oxidase superfamily)